MAAMQVLAAHWGGGLPVQPKWIAKALGAGVVVADLDDDDSGKIERRQGRALIHLNRSDHQLRQRFTIAHELGHLIHNQDRNSEYVEHRGPLATQGVDEGEVFSNAFAAELLMPEATILILLEMGMEKPQMAREFAVSEAAMTTRLDSLGLHP